MLHDTTLYDDLTQLRARWRERGALFAAYGADGPARALAQAGGELEAVLRASTTRTVSVAEYARFHGVQAATVRRWIKRGELRATKDTDGNWTLTPSEVRRKAPRRVRQLEVAA